MNQIQLTREVIASDPCYALGTWCQIELKNVKPGKYNCFVKEYNLEDWGKRNSMILVIHQDNINDDDLTWKEYDGVIGVDSASFGFFSKEKFGGEQFEEDCHKATGREALCNKIIPDKTWGIVEQGVACISGLGDGSYILYTAEKAGQIVAMSVDFAIEEDGEEIDFDWFKK